MKTISAVVFVFIGLLICLSICCSPLAAQTASQEFPNFGRWELGVLAGGGAALSSESDAQFAFAGGRIGRVVTRPSWNGWTRGELEIAVDVLPLYTVSTSIWTTYGGSFKPLDVQWNFTQENHKVVPFVAAAGGILFTNRAIPPGYSVFPQSPPGPTSQVNFTPQLDMGVRVFRQPKRAILLEADLVHHSSAGLGRFNPGYPLSLFFTMGYSWYK
jgi:hypothetical protein